MTAPTVLPREEFADDIRNVAMLTVDLIVEPPHIRFRDSAGECGEGFSDLRMFPSYFVAQQWHCVVWRKIMPIVFKSQQVERIDEPVC